MMTERFTIFTFSLPIPMPERQAGWTSCGSCAARFYMRGAASTAALKSEPESPGPVHQPGACSDGAASMVSSLQSLAELRAAGMLTEDEYAAAKQRVLSA